MLQSYGLSSTLASSIDKGSYLNVPEDGMVSTDNNIFMHFEGDDGFMGKCFFFLTLKKASMVRKLRNRCAQLLLNRCVIFPSDLIICAITLFIFLRKRRNGWERTAQI